MMKYLFFLSITAVCMAGRQLEPIVPQIPMSLLETSSEQEIQTIKDYLEQLKLDIKKSAEDFVSDSVTMMEELTQAIKALKKRVEQSIDRVNSKAENKLLAIKAIEELIGFRSAETTTEPTGEATGIIVHNHAHK